MHQQQSHRSIYHRRIQQQLSAGTPHCSRSARSSLYAYIETAEFIVAVSNSGESWNSGLQSSRRTRQDRSSCSIGRMTRNTSRASTGTAAAMFGVAEQRAVERMCRPETLASRRWSPTIEPAACQLRMETVADQAPLAGAELNRSRAGCRARAYHEAAKALRAGNVCARLAQRACACAARSAPLRATAAQCGIPAD